MKSALWVIPVWVFAFGAIWLSGSDPQNAKMYAGIGGLAIAVANALMIQHRRIAELERSLAALAPEAK
jgi:hypothetical protein